MVFGFGVGIQRLGSIGVPNLAALTAIAPLSTQRPTGIVYADGTVANNGIYTWNGSAWAKQRGLPDGMGKFGTVTGTNTLTATLATGVDPATVVTAVLVPAATNSGAVTLNGEAVHDRSGNALASGALVSGKATMLYRHGSTWRLITSELAAISDISGLQDALDTHTTNINAKADQTALDAAISSLNSAITAAVDTLKGGVSTAFDTLAELAAGLAAKWDATVVGALAAKTAAVDADKLLVLDSAAGFAGKLINIAQFKASVATGGENDAALAIALAEAKDAPVILANGFADEFSSEDGVDVQAATPGATGTAIGNMTDGAGLAAAFDGTTNQASASGARKLNGTDNGATPRVGGYIGKDWGSGNTKTISGFAVIGPNNEGINNITTGSTITITLEGSTDNFSSSVVNLGSFTFTDTAVGALQTQLSGFTTTTAYRYHRLKVHSSGTFSGGGCSIAEVIFYEGNGLSSGQSYNAASDFYSPVLPAEALISGATGTNIGNFTARGGLAAAFDGNASNAYAAAAGYGFNGGAVGYLGKTYSGGKKISKAVVTPSPDQQFDALNGTITLTLYGKQGAAPSNATDGTALGTSGAFADASGAKTINSSNTTTLWDHVWIAVATTANPGALSVSEVKFYEAGTRQNMTLVGKAKTATAAPSKAHLALQVLARETIVLNTDLKGWASRDDGATWVQGTLVLKSIVDGVALYEANNIDLSASPTGTAMRWKSANDNNKHVDHSAVCLRWG